MKSLCFNQSGLILINMDISFIQKSEIQFTSEKLDASM